MKRKQASHSNEHRTHYVNVLIIFVNTYQIIGGNPFFFFIPA